jgi:hypothetical protein
MLAHKSIPSGKYTVWAHPRRTANGTPIQYWVRVQLDDEVKVCSGTNDTLSRCAVPAYQKN